MKYRLTTLGCRVNHAEARELESLLADRGLERAGPGQWAEVEVIHSCSVTNTAAAKSRHALRRALKRQSNRAQHAQDDHLHDPMHDGLEPMVLVTGCYAATNAEEAAGLVNGRDRVISHDTEDGLAMPERFAQRLDEWLGRHRPQVPIRRPRPASSAAGVVALTVVPPRSTASAHVRAELKIQDGCDACCTFCIIPQIRRTLRSKTICDAVAEARQLVELGHREIVLTGVFIGAYGHETALRRRQARPGSEPLADLVDAVAQVPGLARLRLSSMEPGDVTEPLLDAMVANAPVVVPHLHLPLQSGSDAVLRRMNRQYRIGAYLEMIDRVNGAITNDGLGPAITTDIICGFPGETEADFAQTLQVAQRVGYLHMHVFPFSPKRGTAAARWTDSFVDAPTTKSRVRRLIDMENDPTDGLSIRYRRRLLGRTVRVIVEQRDRDDPNLATGRCDHYALIHVPTDRPRGSVVQVKVTEVTATRTIGVLACADVTLPVLEVHSPAREQS